MPKYYQFNKLGRNESWLSFSDDGVFTTGLDLVGEMLRASIQSFATNQAVCGNDPFVALSFNLEEPAGWNCRVIVFSDRQSAQIHIPINKLNTSFWSVLVTKSDLVNSSKA